MDNCHPGKKKTKEREKISSGSETTKILLQNYFIWTKSRKKIMSTRTSTNYMVQWKWSHHMTGGFYLTKKSPLLYPLRMAWYSGYLIGKGSNVGKNGKKQNETTYIKSQRKKESWAGWTGEGKKAVLPNFRSARLNRRLFWVLFPDCEAWSQAKMLDETPKNVIHIVLISQITAHVVKRVTAMFILVLLINITSILVAIRINTISGSANLTKLELFRYKTS